MKNCIKCGESKELDDFCRDKRKKDKHTSICKICFNRTAKIKLRTHPELQEYHKIYGKQWYLLNRDKNREKNRASTKKWRTENPERHNKYNQQWAKDHPVIAKEMRLRKTAKKRSTAKGRIDDSLRASIRHSLKPGVKNGRPWEKLVGYTVEQLKKHLEKQFRPGMTWENYGKWHIDHRIPISAFNYEKPEDIDFKQCWMLRNLRPLWAVENIGKLNKIDKPFQPSLAMSI